jgi:class 3 adenylate cyclase/tetratricopeptide (TPR) repeat protein
MTPIARWLQAHGLSAYTELFEHELIDLDALPHLGDADLKALGLPTGPRVKLLAAAAELKRPSPLAEPTSPDHYEDAVVRDAERRQLTILFCDLVGSTQLSQTLDPEQLRELMRAYQQVCGKVIERFDGHVAQYLGDGLMVYFGWPKAHENDAERAVRASLQILEAVKTISAPSPLHVRIGIATGAVVVGETGGGDASVPKLAVGETPNLAARLQGLAGSDQIVISPSTQRLLGSTFEYQDLGDHTLKGIIEPVRVSRVLGESHSEGRFEAAHGAAVLTPMVGREEEIALLLRRWQDAQSGEGQVVLLGGEPGIGKSRITRALRERIEGQPHLRLRYQCSPFHTQSAFYPVIEQLERAAGFSREDSSEHKLDKLEALLAQGLAREPLRAVAPLFATLLSLPTERYAALGYSPQKQKERTLEALTEQVAALCAHQPLLMVFEDAHWIDPSTQESLDLLVSRIARLPVLLLITYRSEYVPPWSGEPHVTSLALSRLNRRLGAQLADRVTGGKALPREVLEQIMAKTDGVPLFVEELTKTVLESGLLKDNGDHYVLSGPLPPLGIPSTLHDSLMARLDRLAPIKETAQIGACIGREFTHELIAAISPLPGPKLTEALEQLVQSQLIFRQGTPPDATYIFKHALVQDAAYGSLLKSKRQQLHAQIAQALVGPSSQGADARPEFIAHQFTEAGMVAQAIQWWAKAADQAGQHSANAEAVAHHRKAVELLSSLPDSAVRNVHEVGLQVALGYDFIRQLGWAADPVAKCLTRAAELCREIGDAPQLVPALIGMSTFFVVRGDQRQARAFAQQSLNLALQSGDTGDLIEAHIAMAAALQFSGRLNDARRHCEECIALYDPERHRAQAFVYGQDPKVCALCWLAWSLEWTGHLDQALAAAEQALELARTLDHPGSVAWGYAVLGTLFWVRGNEGTDQILRSGLTFCRERGVPYWENMYSWYLGGYRVQRQGRFEEGVALIRDAISAHRAAGNGNCLPQMLANLAEAYLGLDQLDEASSAIREGLECVDSNDEHLGEPDLYRLSAELALARPTPDERQAEANFQKALARAMPYEQALFGLRAAMGLARLWDRQGRRAEAKRLLSDTYNAFTEGLDTFELVAARKLLDELE